MTRKATPPVLEALGSRANTDLLVDILAAGNTARDAGIQNIPVDLIDDNPYQPRTEYAGIDELAEDITRNGLLQTPRGRWVADAGPRVQLQYGHRRLRAIRLLGWETMPVDIQPASDDDMAIRAWAENHNRQDFTPLDQARYFQSLQAAGWTQQRIATAVGVSRPTIANALRLLQLPEAMQAQVAAAGLSARQAEALVSLTQLPPALTEAARRHWDEGQTPAGITRAALAGASSDEIRERTRQLIDRYTTTVHDEPWYRHEFPGHLADMVSPRCDECEIAIRRDSAVLCPDNSCQKRKWQEWGIKTLMAASIQSGINVADQPWLNSSQHEDFTYTGDAGAAVLKQQPRCKNLRLVALPPKYHRVGLTQVDGHPEAFVVCQKAGNNQCACLNKARNAATGSPHADRTSGKELKAIQQPCIDVLAAHLATLPPGLLTVASLRFHVAYDTKAITPDNNDIPREVAQRALNQCTEYVSPAVNRRIAEQILSLAGLRAPWLPPVQEEIAQQLDQVEIFLDTFIDPGDGLPTPDGISATFAMLDAAQHNLAALDPASSIAPRRQIDELRLRLAALSDRAQADRDHIPTEL